MNLKSLLLASLAIALVACGGGRNPTAIAGVWKYGEPGLFSAQILLDLRKDGTCSMNATASIAGSDTRDGYWGVEDEHLFIADKGQARPVKFKILAVSKQNLTLQAPDNTTLVFQRTSSP